MNRFTPLDERFAHQIPEPFPNTVTFHQEWRESLFFVMHSPDGPGDVVISTLAHFPARGEMDSLQLGRVGGNSLITKHVRTVDGDQDVFKVGGVTIDIIEPLKKVRIQVVESPATSATLDITFTARTQPYQLRRGTMKAGHEIVWDQSHMFQSGTYNGTYTYKGQTHNVENWWGQRDHSWGIRAHGRCPMWMWLAIQLPEGMLGVWNWEYPNGARVYTDGCFAPSDGSDPIPVIGFEHDLQWQDENGNETSYDRFGENVRGLGGVVHFTLQGGRKITVTAQGKWAQRYSDITNRTGAALGGGLSEMVVTTSDGTKGTAIYEVTGSWHHKYFPLARGERLPPNGITPGENEIAR